MERVDRISTSLRRADAVRWTGPALVAAILLVMAFPWPLPSPEVERTSFDPLLVGIEPGPAQREGLVSVAADEIVLSAAPGSTPTVHLLTAEVPFAASFSTTTTTTAPVNGGPTAAFPLRVALWNPRADVALEAWCGPDGVLAAGRRVPGTWTEVRPLGRCVPRAPMRWNVAWDGHGALIEVTRSGERLAYSVDAATFPAFFKQETLSLSLSSAAGSAGPSRTVISAPRFTVARQTRYGTAVAGEAFKTLVALLALGAALWLGQAARRNSSHWVLPQRRDLAVAGLLAAVAVLGGAALLPLPAHPVDARFTDVWAHIGQIHGPAAIPRYSLLATEGAAHGGPPFAAMTYPYPPVLTYLFALAGKLTPAGGSVTAIKLIATAALGVTAGILYLTLRRLNVRRPLAAAAAAAVALNPALHFAGAVWGQTDALVGLFLVLGAAGAAAGNAPLLVTGVVLAVLSKQTGAILAPLLVAWGTARLGFAGVIRGAIPAVLVVFLMLAPLFASGLHPASVYRPLVTKVLAFGTLSHMEVSNAVVAQTGFTLWSGVAALEGARGWERHAYPDFLPSTMALPFFTLAGMVFAAAVAVLIAVLFRHKASPAGLGFTAAATYAAGVAILLTRVSPRYLYFALLFAAAALPWLPRRQWMFVTAAFTVTMLLSMWGMFAFTSLLYPGQLVAFNPDVSSLNGLAASALGSDVGITLGAALNCAALLVLLFSMWKTPRRVTP